METARSIAFFLIGRRGTAMLGLWKVPNRQVTPLHLAFESTVEAITEGSIPFFKKEAWPLTIFYSAEMASQWFGRMPAVIGYADWAKLSL